jgi:hypothetical protein
VDHRQLICPRPPSPILLRGCNINGHSLLRALPTGFVMPQTIGSVAPCAKTNRLPGCCHQNHMGGPFFMGLASLWNAPTRIDWFSSCVVQLCTGLSQKNILSVEPYSTIQLVHNSSKKNLFLQTLECKKCLYSPLKMMAFHYLLPPVEPW